MRRISEAAASADESRSSADSTLGGRVQLIEIENLPGLLPQQGVRALTQILQVETPHSVVVSSHPIDRLVRQIAVPNRVNDSSTAGTDIEGTLTNWFQDLLGLDKVELDDDFFSLGGHSLIGVRLFAKIKSTYQVDLELATLFQARTIRLLADVIRSSQHPVPTSEERKWSYLVPIQPKGSRVPIFLIHAVGGEVLFYEPLSKALGFDQPLYALQSYLANREEIRETSIEEMASTYLDEIQGFFPEGPYLIGGHSFGGLVAFEMARQLHAQGKDPALLVLLDAVVPGSTHSIAGSAQLRTLIRSLREQGLPYLFNKAHVKRLASQEKLIHRLQVAAYSSFRNFRHRFPSKFRYALIEEMHRRALGRYSLKPYEGTITLIRAKDRGYDGAVSLSEVDDPMLGWGPLADGGVQVHEISSDHSNMLLESQVRFVAGALNAILSNLETTASQALSSK